MLSTLLAFLPVAAVLTLTPGVATALVVRSAARGGRREALLVTVGNSLGDAGVGGVRGGRRGRGGRRLGGAVHDDQARSARSCWSSSACRGCSRARPTRRRPRRAPRCASGLVTSLANPKLAVFFVALFPQFIPEGAPVLPSALRMAATIVALDLVWYSALAYGVARTRRAFEDALAEAGGAADGRGARRARLRLALERR